MVAVAQHDFRLGASSCLRRLINARNIDGALELKQKYVLLNRYGFKVNNVFSVF